MANTERLAALARVRLARNAVQAARGQAGLSPEDQSRLVLLFADLDDLEDQLILRDISEDVDSIRKDATELKDVVAGMASSATKLGRELGLVDDAAKAVGALAEVVSLASSHGLVP
jgi:hypothetical protein